MKTLLYIACFVMIATAAHAQCYPDRHNTSWSDAWMSCSTSPNPNPLRGNSHWIQYDFGDIYALDEMHIWNANVPDQTDRGFQQVAIDYSEDGNDWTELGVFQVDEAPGSSFYQGVVGPDFAGEEARYVILTALSNYGGTCYSLSEVRFNIANSAVPVELVEFKAECSDGRAIILSWQTASEINNDHFTLERSADGRQWEVVQIVDGHGTTSDRIDYEWTDVGFRSTTNLYRLSQTDIDGRSKVAGIVSVECERTITNIRAFPNPFQGELTVELQSTAVESVHYSLTDALGRVVLEGQLDVRPPLSTVVLSTKDLVPGNYTLNVRRDHVVDRLKVVHIAK